MTDKIYVIAWSGENESITGYFTNPEQVRAWLDEFQSHWKRLSPETTFWYDEKHGYLWRSLSSDEGSRIVANIYCLSEVDTLPYGRCPDAYSMY